MIKSLVQELIHR